MEFRVSKRSESNYGLVVVNFRLIESIYKTCLLGGNTFSSIYIVDSIDWFMGPRILLLAVSILINPILFTRWARSVPTGNDGVVVPRPRPSPVLRQVRLANGTSRGS